MFNVQGIGEMMVKIYSRTICPACNATKRWLKEHGIDYVELNTDLNPMYLEQAQATGFKSLPVIITDDDKWFGYAPNKLKNLI